MTIQDIIDMLNQHKAQLQRSKESFSQAGDLSTVLNIEDKMIEVDSTLDKLAEIE